MNFEDGRLGRYEIKSRLGKGGMGEVYLARDTTALKRMVAIKVLPAEFAASSEHMQRFVREARLAVRAWFRVLR